jgi:hypothetical protein
MSSAAHRLQNSTAVTQRFREGTVSLPSLSQSRGINHCPGNETLLVRPASHRLRYMYFVPGEYDVIFRAIDSLQYAPGLSGWFCSAFFPPGRTFCVLPPGVSLDVVSGRSPDRCLHSAFQITMNADNMRSGQRDCQCCRIVGCSVGERLPLPCHPIKLSSRGSEVPKTETFCTRQARSLRHRLSAFR